MIGGLLLYGCACWMMSTVEYVEIFFMKGKYEGVYWRTQVDTLNT